MFEKGRNIHVMVTVSRSFFGTYIPLLYFQMCAEISPGKKRQPIAGFPKGWFVYFEPPKENDIGLRIISTVSRHYLCLCSRVSLSRETKSLAHIDRSTNFGTLRTVGAGIFKYGRPLPQVPTVGWFVFKA